MMAMSRTESRPSLFYLIGYPGAGKTTFARQLARYSGASHLSADQIAFSLFYIPSYTKEETDILHATMEQQAAALISAGKSVIYDASANSYFRRQRLAELARRTNATAVGIWIRTPAPAALRRCCRLRPSEYAARVFRTVPAPLFHQLVMQFEAPDLAVERAIVSIPGTAPFSQQLRLLDEQQALVAN